MAATRRLQGLRDEVTCSICLGFFNDPVTTDCGHNYCRSCITQYWKGTSPSYLCPQCRSESPGRNLRPNRELGLIVDLIKLNPQEEELCPKHQQKLQLFCEKDHTPLCLVCRESREHKAHTVCPIEEVAQEHKATLRSHLERLNSELEDLQKWAAEESSTASELEGTFKKQREKILRTFEHLKQFLERKKQQLLSRLEKEQEENMKTIQEKLTRLEKEQSTYRSLMTELERKCQQKDVELLKDGKSILDRCGEVKDLKLTKDALRVTQTLQSTKQPCLLEELLELKETFPAQLESRYAPFYACEVTLDPGTAHTRLIVSTDGRSVRRGDGAQALPNTPQRFTNAFCALGREGLSSGRHYWEVEVGGSTAWTLGVCDESVPRKGEITLSPQGGRWTVRLWDGKYWACTSPPTPLTPCVPPRVLGFFLDYEAGRLSVYDAQNQALLFTFPGTSFPRTLRPYFQTRSSEALKILPGAGGD
ncbi:E3 ubiquitin-protein ligase TRIM39-like [Ambystoma mexicanum]|uniref:E3 ubiquitin-protein ligase TRIM39-like n=1 Tax=Ambystoma mexicanum TaxID=8296 RepID=UPI0037E917C3